MSSYARAHRLLKRWVTTDPALPLEEQFFQTLSALSAFICLLVITPINYFQNLSSWINCGIVAFGTVSAAISWAARRGRYFKKTFIVGLVGLLDLIWFPNCGTQGSVGLYYFAAALFIIIFFERRTRIIGLLLLAVNVTALLSVEMVWPNAVTTFESTTDRFIDLTSGYLITLFVCSLILWVSQAGFDRERLRVKGAVHELEEREAELRAIFESSQYAIGVSREDAIELVNQAFVSVFGYSDAAELVGARLDDLIELDPDDVAPTSMLPGALKDPPSKTREVECRRKDGTRFPAELTVSSYRLQGVVHTVVSLTDLTERKRFEQQQRQYEEQARRNDKMESLGALAGGVAHDMNNILGAVLGIASVHLREATAGSTLHEDMGTIITACQRGGAMVKGLLTFARDGLPVQLDLDLNAIVQETVALLERTTLQKVRMQVELAPSLAGLRGDPAALSHALMNLCVNAVDAMPLGGTLTLRTRNHDEATVILEVADTGGGMSQEVLARALEPFYTTKPMGKGTGLGLPIVFGTVKAHQGRMEIRSELGRGTQVTLLLPAHRDVPGTPSHETQQPSNPPVRMLNVLLVDDDELVQHAVHRILRSMGHAVTTVSGGRSALNAIEAGLRPDLVVLDMNMPELDGAATLPRLRELLPNVPVVLATGRADERAMDLVESYARVTLLPKPFNASELGSKFASVGRGVAEKAGSPPGQHKLVRSPSREFD